MCNPMICIVFNSGAFGDFLARLIYEQINHSEDRIIIDENGTAKNPPGDNFKKACMNYYNNNYNVKFFSETWDNVVNTHHCNAEIIKLFPHCKFYYIDDTNFLEVVIDAYIKKRVNGIYANLDEWRKEYGNIHLKSSLRNITDSQIKKIMMIDWRRNTVGWKSLNLEPIKIIDIVEKDRCYKILSKILDNRINELIFSQTFDSWKDKNTQIIDRLMSLNYG